MKTSWAGRTASPAPISVRTGKLPLQRYAITGRSLLPVSRGGWEAALLAQATRWVAAGVEWVQLREKDLPENALVPLIRKLAGLTQGSGTRLLVNGLSPGFAIDAGADGVHLPGGSTVPQIRAAVTVARCVTVSCHTPDDVAAAHAGGAAAILWAPVFEKSLNGATVRPGTGLAALVQACSAAQPVPVFALGGVTPANAAECLRAGAVGVAGIRLFAGDGWTRLV